MIFFYHISYFYFSPIYLETICFHVWKRNLFFRGGVGTALHRVPKFCSCVGTDSIFRGTLGTAFPPTLTTGHHILLNRRMLPSFWGPGVCGWAQTFCGGARAHPAP